MTQVFLNKDGRVHMVDIKVADEGKVIIFLRPISQDAALLGQLLFIWKDKVMVSWECAVITVNMCGHYR